MSDTTRKLATIVALDVAGYSARTEADEARTTAEVAALRKVIEAIAAKHGGRVFNTAGDGFMLEFGSSLSAVEAAAELATTCEPKVRVGVHLGDVVVQPNGDLLGHGVNVAARLMARATPGSALVSSPVRGSIRGPIADRLQSRGMLKLDKMAETIEAFAFGDAEPSAMPSPDAPDANAQSRRASLGNLPTPASSFVGRDAELADLAGLMRAHRLVTLTGVGGVGKTRLALRVAAEMMQEFPDGVWLAELAPVSDPEAVPTAVATALAITPQGTRSVIDAIADALSGRRLLLVLDNCEHVLDVAADIAEALLSRTDGVSVIATSREGLRVAAEHLWPVPSLNVRDGVHSAAVQLFVDRARAVKPGFVLREGAEADAVTAICQRLDGIALAIELAAARMVSMTPGDLLNRLTDRFRLLSGSRRGLERHQTLRQAVQWSYDLLTEDEQLLLNRCSVFAGGFDLAAAGAICGGDAWDELAVLDLLDSLVRKSLVTVEHVADHMRYGLLETIRQFAEEKLAASGTIDDLRDRHARHYAGQAERHWDMLYGHQTREALEWANVEYANLRTGFRWAADKADIVTAADIAAHATTLCFELNRFEPTRWIEEVLPAAVQADIKRLPRLYSAATMSIYDGRWEQAPVHARKAISLQNDRRYDPFPLGIGMHFATFFHYVAGGDADEALAVFDELSNWSGTARAWGLFMQISILSACGRMAEAKAIATELISAARVSGNPYVLMWADVAFGRIQMDNDLGLAKSALQSALSRTRELRGARAESVVLMELAALQGLAGDITASLASFDHVVDVFQRTSNPQDLHGALGALAVLFDRNKRPEIAAILHGASQDMRWPIGLLPAIENMRNVLGDERFAAAVATGRAMDSNTSASYAREQIAAFQRELASS